MVGKILTSGSYSGNSSALFSNLLESPRTETDLMRQPHFLPQGPTNLPNKVLLLLLLSLFKCWLNSWKDPDIRIRKWEFLCNIFQPFGVSLHWDWLHRQLTPSFYLRDPKFWQIIIQMWAKWLERSRHEDQKMGIPLHYSPASGSLCYKWDWTPLYHFQAEFLLALSIWMEFQEHALPQLHFQYPTWSVSSHRDSRVRFSLSPISFLKCIIYCTHKYRSAAVGRQEQPVALWGLRAQEFPSQTFSSQAGMEGDRGTPSHPLALLQGVRRLCWMG